MNQQYEQDVVDTEFTEDGSMEKKKKLMDPRAKRNMKVIGIGFGVATAIIGIMFAMTGGEDPTQASTIQNAGGKQRKNEDVSEAYRGLIAQENQDRQKESEQTGESYLPTIVGTPRADEIAIDEPQDRVVSSVGPSATGTQDVRMGNNRGGSAQQVQYQVYDDVLADPVVQRHYENQVEYIRGLMDKGAPIGHTTVEIIPSTYLEDREAERARIAQLATAPAPAAPGAQAGGAQAAVPPLYGEQLLRSAYIVLNKPITADYDPLVIATVQTGPYRGARLQGEAKRAADRMNIVFSTMIYGGQTYAINAVALDEKTQSAMVSGDYDSEFFDRVFVPFMFGLGQGFAEGKADRGVQVFVGDNGQIAQSQRPFNEKEAIYNGIAQGLEDTKGVYSETARQPSVSTPAARELLVVWLAA